MSLPHKILIVFLLKLLVFIPGFTVAQTNPERIESDRNDENGFLSIFDGQTLEGWFQFFIYGKPASEFTDNVRLGRLDYGAIGLQIHDKGMQVEFKDVRLKYLVPRK